MRRSAGEAGEYTVTSSLEDVYHGTMCDWRNIITMCSRHSRLSVNI